MINNYWKILEWLATHKMGYLAALIYVVFGATAFPCLVLLLGVIGVREIGAVSAFNSTLKSLIKGEKV